MAKLPKILICSLFFIGITLIPSKQAMAGNLSNDDKKILEMLSELFFEFDESVFSEMGYDDEIELLEWYYDETFIDNTEYLRIQFYNTLVGYYENLSPENFQKIFAGEFPLKKESKEFQYIYDNLIYKDLPVRDSDHLFNAAIFSVDIHAQVLEWAEATPGTTPAHIVESLYFLHLNDTKLKINFESHEKDLFRQLINSNPPALYPDWVNVFKKGKITQDELLKVTDRIVKSIGEQSRKEQHLYSLVLHALKTENLEMLKSIENLDATQIEFFQRLPATPRAQLYFHFVNKNMDYMPAAEPTKSKVFNMIETQFKKASNFQNEGAVYREYLARLVALESYTNGDSPDFLKAGDDIEMPGSFIEFFDDVNIAIVKKHLKMLESGESNFIKNKYIEDLIKFIFVKLEDIQDIIYVHNTFDDNILSFPNHLKARLDINFRKALDRAARSGFNGNFTIKEPYIAHTLIDFYPRMSRNARDFFIRKIIDYFTDSYLNDFRLHGDNPSVHVKLGFQTGLDFFETELENNRISKAGQRKLRKFFTEADFRTLKNQSDESQIHHTLEMLISHKNGFQKNKVLSHCLDQLLEPICSKYLIFKIGDSKTSDSDIKIVRDQLVKLYDNVFSGKLNNAYEYQHFFELHLALNSKKINLYSSQLESLEILIRVLKAIGNNVDEQIKFQDYIYRLAFATNTGSPESLERLNSNYIAKVLLKLDEIKNLSAIPQIQHAFKFKIKLFKSINTQQLSKELLNEYTFVPEKPIDRELINSEYIEPYAAMSFGEKDKAKRLKIFQRFKEAFQKFPSFKEVLNRIRGYISGCLR